MKKTSKKAALAIAAMLVGSVFCTPVFASQDVYYDGQWWNGVAVGRVGQQFGTGYVGGNVISGTGAYIDSWATSFNANGVVGDLIGQGVQVNKVNSAIGAAIGYSDHATAIGTVGSFSNNTYFNTIELATGAEVGGGAYNRATGYVGIFEQSSNNQLKQVVGGDAEGYYYIGSRGAYIQGGSYNTATGTVGQFTTAGSTLTTAQLQAGALGADANAELGNTVYASQGAVILAGDHNNADGKVGIFTGTLVGSTNGGAYVSGTNGNIVNSSTGAFIQNGSYGQAIGTVGSFTGSASINTVTGTGAVIDAGIGNKAIGLVGSFTGTAMYNNVTGTGAWIMSGNNNYANGTVGSFSTGGNTVKGTGVVIAQH